MTKSVISDTLQEKMQAGDPLDVTIVANPPSGLEDELKKIHPKDLKLRRSFLDYKRLEATTLVAGYFEDRNINYDRVKINYTLSATLPVALIQDLADNHGLYNIKEIVYTPIQQVVNP